jgi:hypothetical protein
MKITRRAFLRTVPAIGAALTLPIPARPASAACRQDDPIGPSEICEPTGELARPAGDPPWEPIWVKTFLPTKSWPTAEEVVEPLGDVPADRLFRVDAPQRGYRLLVWNPRENQHFYIGAEAVGPVEPPFWSTFADDGRWIDVNLTVLQHLKLMQGDREIFRDLVTAGLQGATKPGFYRIFRRVYNETMDSRTMPDIRDSYLLKDVLYTQYFAGNGSAIHYNWWGPPNGFGRPGSHGCLGMRMAGSKLVWDWADIGTPVVIHY